MKDPPEQLYKKKHKRDKKLLMISDPDNNGTFRWKQNQLSALPGPGRSESFSCAGARLPWYGLLWDFCSESWRKGGPIEITRYQPQLSPSRHSKVSAVDTSVWWRKPKSHSRQIRSPLSEDNVEVEISEALLPSLAEGVPHRGNLKLRERKREGHA